MWQIWIDTGGTFTDCLGLNPEGQLHRTKVLSSSFLRGTILQKTAPNTYEVSAPWASYEGLFRGYDFRVLGQNDFFKIADFTANKLVLEEDISVPHYPFHFEITTHEEAPVLATRLITQTPLHAPFPALTMRLGTTKGTNALLERKGAKVALFVTKGFGDLLKIDTQQRPHLFQLAIPDLVLLYDQVIEVEERLDADGNLLQPLDTAKIQDIASDSVAISFLHSYKNPVHENALRHHLLGQGHEYVSSSAELYAGINYLKRTQTALINAYLQPILSDYLRNITASLGQEAVRVMTSAGGLVHSSLFRAKDSLLSGPAGGMVGAAAITQQLGFERCLTFDMGGTSTDTARFDNKLDVEFVTKIEGIELHNPTLAIETVAAGGGSICYFDGQKLRVGPESAGAQPGPACYGAGGPLTITDVNLLLGKMDSSRFGVPINPNKAQQALQTIQEQILTQTSQKLSEIEILRGFEQIANEKMAEAIRRISVAKGFAPKDYPLLTFGGAGGLHGCQLADILGIDTVILPYDAGLLSAFGMGQARAQRIANQQVLKLLEDILPELDELIHTLAAEATTALHQEQIKEVEIEYVLLYLRFKGQENALEIVYQSADNLAEQFREKYRQLFGYYPSALAIEVESIKLIASEKVEYQTSSQKYEPIRKAQPFKVSSGQYAIFDWESLENGDFFEGPAVLLNATSTSFIPERWRLVVTPTKDAVVHKLRAHRPQETQEKTTQQTIELELFTNRFMAIADEMGAQLQRTAFSVNVKERLDFSCAILDAQAELLVNAPHIPVHLGSLGVCARLVFPRTPLRPGEVVIVNHPKYGGSHLPDVTLLAGVFTPEGDLIGYVINRAHHAEIGGRTPGSMPPDAISLAEEGVVILPTYLVINDQIQWEAMEELFLKGPYPTRSFTENMADINAALSSLKSGQIALQSLVAQHGLARVQHYMKLLKDSTFSALKEALQPIKNHTFTALESLDDGHQISVKIITSPQDSSPSSPLIAFDFSGTSSRHPFNLNANISIIYSAILYVLRLLVNKNIPLNEGLTQGIEVILPPDSFLHPEFSDDPSQCPAVVGGNTEVSQRLVDTLLKAFGLAACSQGTMNNFLFGNEQFGYYETICGGTGATPQAHGRSAVHQHMTNTRITDAEELERRYPVRLDEFAIRENSGGQGQWNGGDGVVRELTFLAPLRVTLITQHRQVAPYGIMGGKNGQTGRQTLTTNDGKKHELSGICSLEVVAGDKIRIETPGGGGYGSQI